MNFIDISGRKFNMLTVISRYGQKCPVLWRCLCDCGNKCIVTGNNIKSGTTKSCGCMRQKLKNVSGQKFGSLTLIEYIYGEHKWKCKCDCGNFVNISAGHLNNGSTISCGCYTQLISMIGQEFGYLKVIGFSHTAEGSNSYWNCKCDCGNITKVSRSNLLAGNSRSCGCHADELQEQTNLKRYGTKSSFQNIEVRNKFEQNNIEKYGVPYPAQDPKIALKTAKSQKNCFIEYHWKTGEELVCTASWEKRVVEYLNKNKKNFIWKPGPVDVVVDGKKRKYFIDLYLVDEDKWVEIKGQKRYLGMKKWKYFHRYIHINSELWDKEKLKEMGIL